VFIPIASALILIPPVLEQGRAEAVALDPFIVVVAAIFGGTLFGVIGALLAIPTAAALMIALREYLANRREIDRREAPSA
jgi:predicted PurR-regulated permease PerM